CSELTYDTYSANSKQLYRVYLSADANGGTTIFPSVDVAVGPGIKKAFPSVLAYTRLDQHRPVFVKYDAKTFKEEKIMFIDSNFLQMFSIPLLKGDSKNALTEPETMVITKDFEKKYFGDGDGLGKMITVGKNLVKVTGVIDKIPDNSHFHGDAFMSFATEDNASTPQTWSNVNDFTYLLLNKNADPHKLEAAFPQLVAQHVVPEVQHDMGVSLAEAQKSVNTFKFLLQPITDIHLHSASKYELEPSGDIHYVYIFAALAIFVLLLACINFTNLSTAAATKRAKEIGVRKVLGSEKNKLVWQFLTESLMLTLFSMVLALGLVYLLLPYFNNVAGKHVTIAFYFSSWAIAAELGLTLVVGLMAGLYPAVFMSSFKIIPILKGGNGLQLSGKSSLRSGLIVFQFAISTALIIATLVVFQQLSYMQNKKLGYDKNQVLVVNDAYTLGNNIDAFKQDLVNDHRVVSVTKTDNAPGYDDAGGTVIYAKEIADKGTRTEIPTSIYWIDSNYISTLKMELVKGRNFYPSGPADSASVIVNEAEVSALGFGNTDPIGKTIIRSGQRHYMIVGVVKDFHFTSAKQKIAPLMMIASGDSNGKIIARVKTADIPRLISDIKSKWERYNSGAPFNYSFLDQQFALLYGAEQRVGNIFTSFSIIAIIIACLGLFGLAAFMIRQRVKEIGIRKVLGASSVSITTMLSKEFLQLILIAALISFPITWYAMNKWLQDFAYRTTIHWWVFVLAGVIALLVAAITISFQSIKAALANPVKSLRSE
ncbi:MAG TPA: FtsX-like permease family protein, partial [Mucilaginibacter sp.]|nr:FtsX-like permease family protein [Mucilaginibacter sp.]